MSRARSLSRLPGFRDFAPEELALRRHLLAAWRSVAARYGFREYDGPPLEPLDLYVEKSGPEIVGQLYHFRDKGGREVALRPEMTPTLARILAARSRGMAKPIRWFSAPQVFRYERSQRGRLREHFQLNVDIVGEQGVAADAEVLAVAIDAVRALGLGEADFVARVNDRRLAAAVLDAVGAAPETHPGCLAAIDKASRAKPGETSGRLAALGLSPNGVKTLVELLSEGSLDHVADRFRGVETVQAALAPLGEHRSILDAMGLGGFVDFDFAVARGLAYYTGIVFELFDRCGELRAICGGGRYDRLLELVGGEPLPAVGFGMGDVVLTELLRDRELVPDVRSAPDYCVVWVRPADRLAGLALGRRLREAGRSVVYSLRDRTMAKQLKAGSRAGAAAALIIGPEEVARGDVTVRDLRSGEQATRPVAQILEPSRRRGRSRRRDGAAGGLDRARGDR